MRNPNEVSLKFFSIFCTLYTMAFLALLDTHAAAPIAVTVEASNISAKASGNTKNVGTNELLKLEQGESWTYAFHDLPYAFSIFAGGAPYSRFGFAVLTNTFSPGSSLRWEVFDNSTNDAGASGLFEWPAASTNITVGVGFEAAWQDLQGTIRLTMMTGSVVVSGISFEVGLNLGTTDIYRNEFTPVELPIPVVATQSITHVGFQSVTVDASINARNLSTAVGLQWGTTTNYGQWGTPTSIDFDYPVSRQLSISNLALATAYHLRVVASNSAGVAYGPNLTFSTPPPCIVTAYPVTSHTTTSAVLRASVIANGFNTGTYFEWGLTTNYGNLTPLQNLGNPDTPIDVSATVTGLSHSTSYHFRAVAFALGVTNSSQDYFFKTTPNPTNSVITNLATVDVREAIERGGNVMFACNGTLTLSNEIEVASDVTLDATGYTIVFNGNSLTRIFHVARGVVLTLTNITFAHGRAEKGGVILNRGTVYATKCRFTNNAAMGISGVNGTNGPNGISSNTDVNVITDGTPGGAGSAGHSAEGGVVWTDGKLVLRDCVLEQNSLAGGAGGAGGNGGKGGTHCPGGRCPGTARNGAPGGQGGSGGDALGGCIFNVGSLEITECTFANTSVAAGAGGAGGNGGNGGSGSGGGSGMGGAGGSGAISMGAIIFNAGVGFSSNCLFLETTGGAGRGGQGGMQGSSFPAIPSLPGPGGNGGLIMGGAIFNSSQWTVINCTFATNRIYGGDGGSGNQLSGFFSVSPAGDAGSAWGGAIANNGSAVVLSATFAGNTAVPGLSSNAPFPSPNDPGTNGVSYGGNIANRSGSCAIFNTIIANGLSNNCFGMIVDGGHNISSDNTPLWSSVTSSNALDALLLPLADNGGVTRTMALRTNSPALNKANPATSPATDQRGYPRPRGPGYDIGAYEGGAPPLQISRQSNATNTLRWIAEASHVYRLEESTSLGAWMPTFTNLAQSNGWYELPVPVAPSSRYFRLLGD